MSNSNPVPQLDLSQLLIGMLQTTQDSDTNQSILTDFASSIPDTMTTGDSCGTATLTGPYKYDDSGHSTWGYAQYV